MSTLLNGTNQQIRYSVPASGLNVNGDHCLLIVLRIMVTADVTWMGYLSCETSAPATAAVLERSGFSGQLAWSNGSTLTDAHVITDSDGWMLLAARKPTGTSSATLTKGIIGGAAPSHSTETDSHAGAASIASGSIRIGNTIDNDWSHIKVAAAAILNFEPTNAQLDGIHSAKTTQSIRDLNPVFLVDANDDFAADYMGNATSLSNNGTHDDTDNPTGWVYGVSGGGPTVEATSSSTGGGDVLSSSKRVAIATYAD